MKHAWKKLVSPISLFVVFTSLTVGTTFALFTDEAKTNIDISSGKIVSDMEIEIDKLYSAKYDPEGTLIDERDQPYSYEQVFGTFSNGGIASVANSTLTITNITPGDKLEAVLHLSNDSNIKTKYRYTLAVDEDDYVLASALNITIDGLDASGAAYYASDWVIVDANSSYEKDIPLVIEFPINRGNLYQNRTCSYKINMETVQGNASTTAGAIMNRIESSATALPQNSVVSNVLSLEENETLDISSSTPDPINSGEMVSVSIPSGVKLVNNAKDLVLVVSKVEGSNFEVNSGDEVNVAYNIDVNGVADDNTGLIAVTVPYNNSANPTKIVHTKDDGTRETILPYSELNPTGFSYAGGYITFQTSSFSTFTIHSFKKRIYFANTLGWEKIYAYMWNASGENASFPGVEITSQVFVENSEIGNKAWIHYVEQEDYENVTFNNGNGGNSNQTVDITISEGHQYWATKTTAGDGKQNVASLSFEDAYNSVYFTRNSNEWSGAINYYIWNDSGHKTEWPGDAAIWMWDNSFGQPVFRAPIGNYTSVIFKDGSHQTVDITDLQNKKGKGFYINGKHDNKYTVEEYSVMDYFYTRTLVDAMNDADEGDILKLNNDISIDNPFEISTKVTIDLNGHNISYEGTQFNIFTIVDGGELTITDSSDVVQYGKWNGDEYTISSSPISGGRTFNGGIIYGGKGESSLEAYVYNTKAGGAIIVEQGGRLIINGGNIAGNSVPGNTGGVSNNGGYVELNSGQISDNKAVNGSGAAIYNNKGTFKMTGGVIANNVAIRGAIIVRGATFNLSGGTIENNTAERFMIDVTVYPEAGGGYADVTMSGGTIQNNVCTGNVASAFNIRSGCSFTMTGGTISGNTAAHYISVNNSYDKVYSGGAIVAEESYSGVLTISGGRIENNIGGGVNVYGTGNRLRLSGSAYIYGNYFDAEKTIPLDLFMDAWRGQCPTLVGTLTSSAKIGLYEGHFLNDPDTYGCLLRIGFDFTGNKADILNRLVSNRGANLDYYPAPVVSNVGYWNDGNAYIRQTSL